MLEALRHKYRFAALGMLAESEDVARKPLATLRIPAEEPADLTAGRLVGDFQLVGKIGSGAMGEVWEAEQLSLSRRVALKFVRPERVTAHQMDLFAREARAGGRLSHPGIVTIYGHGEASGRAWIAMEFVAGACTLKDFLDEAVRGPELPPGYDRDVARLVAEIAEALQAAHEAGVIHRDVKPQNVLLTSTDHPKVTDFGLARITDETALSQTGEFAGTYFYMSPEQAMSWRIGLDHRTDIFSLGVVLYELLALRRPFEGDTTHQVAEQILYRDPPDPRTFRSKLPRDMAVIAGKALEKERTKRYSTMKELAADLRRYLADEPIHATPPTRLDRAVKWIRRNPGKSSAVAIVAVTFTVIALLLVANVRTNRALVLKTTEAEASAAEARHQATVAKTNELRATAEKERADQEALTATKRAAEVMRLSAFQQLDELTAEADHLWPAHPANIGAFQSWLARAQDLTEELPTHVGTLEVLRQKAHPWTAEDQARSRATHPRAAELELKRRHLDFLLKRRSIPAAGFQTTADATAEDLGIDWSRLPSNATDLNRQAWMLVSPYRKTTWGEEEKGLLLARRALELASPQEQSDVRHTLAWALYALGRFDEALIEEERARDEGTPDQQAALATYLEDLQRRIASEGSADELRKRSEEIAQLEGQIAALERDVSARRSWTFDDEADRWWHDQLVRLVDELLAFSDEKSGLFSAGTSTQHGWGVKRRLELALQMQSGFSVGGEYEQAWSKAIDEIGRSYPGVSIIPQVGLIPLGPDPCSGYWEFAHLQSGDPARRNSDGRLIIDDHTGIVLVLLPGGTFWMGAQSRDPSRVNYDANTLGNETPVHQVTLGPFFMSKFETTQGQWLRLMEVNPSQYDTRSGINGKAVNLLHPVEQVSWNECADATARLGLMLPTEAQWEFAARANTHTAWWTGDDRESLLGAENLADIVSESIAHENWSDGFAWHAPVGSFRPNAFGLYDMCGNVAEWCRDVYADYRGPALPGDGERRVENPYRIHRGASFEDTAIPIARAAYRGVRSPGIKIPSIGLRTSRSLELP